MVNGEHKIECSAETSVSSAEIPWEKFQLTYRDYPAHYVNKQHPEDYLEASTPIRPEFLVHQKYDNHKLILRVSWKAGSVYIPMSFILDKTIPYQFYMSTKAFDTLERYGLFSLDDLGTYLIVVNFGECEKKPAVFRVEFTPEQYEPGNFIGLRSLMRLGLKLNDLDESFSLGCNISYF